MFKVDFQHDHLEYLLRMILAIFNLQVILILPFKFRVNWPVHKKYRTDFQDGSHIRFLIRTNLTIFICKSARYFLPSFE